MSNFKNINPSFNVIKDIHIHAKWFNDGNDITNIWLYTCRQRNHTLFNQHVHLGRIWNSIQKSQNPVTLDLSSILHINPLHWPHQHTNDNIYTGKGGFISSLQTCLLLFFQDHQLIGNYSYNQKYRIKYRQILKKIRHGMIMIPITIHSSPGHSFRAEAAWP